MTEAPWYERIEKAHSRWDTQDYDMRDIIGALERVPEESDWPMSGPEARELSDLVRALSEPPRTTLNQEMA